MAIVSARGSHVVITERISASHNAARLHAMTARHYQFHLTVRVYMNILADLPDRISGLYPLALFNTPMRCIGYIDITLY
jgi:hypothetical protein